MRVRLFAPPWGAPALTGEAKELAAILGDNVWGEASVRFYATRDAKLRAHKRAPKGMQQTLNKLLEEKFAARGWSGDSGYFFKGKTWVRITFRHQMSLGSDIVDAQKVCKREGMELAIILAAGRETLRVISPNDATALVSFEKLRDEVLSLDGVIDIPLVIGELVPASSASEDVANELLKERPRDVTVPESTLP